MLERIPAARRDAFRARELIPAEIAPDDVAGTVSFLLSSDAAHYTGAVFDLNNGCHFA
jgi:3-oxoacyl-[acyl-carrier protein] reductase